MRVPPAAFTHSITPGLVLLVKRMATNGNKWNKFYNWIFFSFHAIWTSPDGYLHSLLVLHAQPVFSAFAVFCPDLQKKYIQFTAEALV